MKTFQAGALQHNITIQKMVPTQDAYGAEVANWATHATRWAAIQPVSGNERFVNQQYQGEVTHQITVRFIAGVAPKMRVLYGGRYFDILSAVSPDEEGALLVMLCKELV